jgi:hypothetical protein
VLELRRESKGRIVISAAVVLNIRSGADAEQIRATWQAGRGSGRSYENRKYTGGWNELRQ